MISGLWTILFCTTGVIFEQGDPEVQSAFKLALMQINHPNSSRFYSLDYGFNAYADTINTADVFKLSKLSML